MIDADERLQFVHASTINRASQCLQAVGFDMEHGRPAPYSVALAFGSSWDRMQTAVQGKIDPWNPNVREPLDGYYAAKMREGKDLPISETRELFVECWRQEGEKVELWEGANKDDVEAGGLALLAPWHREHAPLVEPLKLQHSFQLKTSDDWALRGTIDLVAQIRGWDKPCAMDLKTSKAKWPTSKFTNNIQAMQYMCAVENDPELPGDPNVFNWEIAVKTKVPQIQSGVTPSTPEQRAAHLEHASKLRKLLRFCIETDTWTPNRGSWLCSRKFCPHADACEARWGGEIA